MTTLQSVQHFLAAANIAVLYPSPPSSLPRVKRFIMIFPCFRELNRASRASFPRCPRNSRKIGDSPTHTSKNPLPTVLTAVATTLHALRKFERGRQRPISKASLCFVIGLLREIWISPFFMLAYFSFYIGRKQVTLSPCCVFVPPRYTF
jgi:hypothetical protein